MNNENMELAKYLEQFNSICWYPSAGFDFRPMLYLSRAWAKRKGWEEEQFPDCFVLTNAFGGEIDNVFMGNHNDDFYSDDWTKIKISSVTEICRLSLPKNPELVYSAEKMWFPDTDVDLYEHYGRILTADVHINSDRLGEWDTKLVYVIAENTAFAMDYILANGVRIDYVYRAHYGYLPCPDGVGSRSTGHFILRILHKLGARYFVTEKDWDDIKMLDSAELIYEEALSGQKEAELTEIITIPADGCYSRNDYFRKEFGFYRVEPGTRAYSESYVPESTKFKYVDALRRDRWGYPIISEPLSISECLLEMMNYVCRLKNIRKVGDFMKLIPPDTMPFPVYLTETKMLKTSFNLDCLDEVLFLRKQWKYLDFMRLLAKLQEIGVVAVPCRDI